MPLTNGVVLADIFQGIPGLVHGVSTKIWGDMKLSPENMGKLFSFLGLNLSDVSVILLDTKHTANIVFLGQPEAKGIIQLQRNSLFIKESYRLSHDWGGHDAAISQAPKTAIAFTPADCAPIMLYEPEQKIWALIHAGRKGLIGKIVSRTISLLKTRVQVAPENLLCYVGPHICASCYKPGGQPVDLTSTILTQLKSSGIREDNWEISDFCTFEHPDLFFSYHRSTDKAAEGRQIAVIGLKG